MTEEDLACLALQTTLNFEPDHEDKRKQTLTLVNLNKQPVKFQIQYDRHATRELFSCRPPRGTLNPQKQIDVVITLNTSMFHKFKVTFATEDDRRKKETFVNVNVKSHPSVAQKGTSLAVLLPLLIGISLCCSIAKLKDTLMIADKLYHPWVFFAIGFLTKLLHSFAKRYY
eukprot:TRINITY_DN12253_c0_g1_i1.p1 TRINITY_DN12253_c0_g1~~TRINITY_DN12253_c0_g1_i1.p1  ORF type:complete len:185 (+),score=29.58 TRINITY_DN12253_c0_g1_i1:45-557(+)